jgi:hypothetical protein
LPGGQSVCPLQCSLLFAIGFHWPHIFQLHPRDVVLMLFSATIASTLTYLMCAD